MSSSTLSSNENLIAPVVDDSDVPITISKGVRSCTQHPISNFVSHNSLSSFYHAFLLSLSPVYIPQG